MGHGWEGVVLKLLRGKDFTFTVTGSEGVIDNDGKPHQRAYTLVDPRPGGRGLPPGVRPARRLHDGCATQWARKVKPGHSIDATLQGAGFAAPDPLPGRLFVLGDPASFPAVNSLLDGLPGVRCRYGWTPRTTTCTPFPAATPAPAWSPR